MPDITTSLGSIKTIFESQGISGDPKIAEHMAFLMLVHQSGLQLEPAATNGWEMLRQVMPADLRLLLDRLYLALRDVYRFSEPAPQPPPERLGVEALRDVMGVLSDVLAECDAGTLFHRYVRFELLKSATGSQYPTPHHVATTMAQLIDLLSGVRLIDPTCGTAGLLVAAIEERQRLAGDDLEIIGCDFDPTWAALGWSNLALHGHSASMLVESALSLLPQQRGRFDRLLMNPPFGGAFSATQLREIIDLGYGRRNETVLTTLALELLSEGGRGAVLVSRAVLSGRGAEQELRNHLLRERLEAVVALPEDVMQPYNSTGANLLLFQKVGDDVQPADPIWFFLLQQDGYPPGTRRDLTNPPDPASNELPLMVEAIQAYRDRDWDVRLRDGEGNDIACGEPLRTDRGVSGNLVLLPGDRIDLTMRAINSQEGLLAAIYAGDGSPTGWFRLSRDRASLIQGDSQNPSTLRWRSLSGVDAFPDIFPEEWSVTSLEESSSAVCKLDRDNQRLRLLRGAYSAPRLELDRADVQDEGAALHAFLIGDDGQPLSPFFAAVNSDETPRDTLGKLDGFQVSLMRNPHGEVVGGVVSLSAEIEGEDDEESETVTAYLLLCTCLETSAYSVQEDGHDQETLAILLDDGLLLVRGNDTYHQVFVDIGEPVAIRQGVTPRGLVLTTRGTALGILLDRDQVSESLDGFQIAKSFEPREYLVVPALERPGLPADILADIRRNQAQLGRKVDALLGMIAVPARLDHPLPPTAVNIPLLIEHLNEVQRTVWKVVRGQCEGASAVHFRPADIWDQVQSDAKESENLTEDAVRQQLDLFERMGLIVSVEVEGQAFYRLSTPLDDATVRPG